MKQLKLHLKCFKIAVIVALILLPALAKAQDSIIAPVRNQVLSRLWHLEFENDKADKSGKKKSEKKEKTEKKKPVPIPESERPSKFTWGADLGSSFDMSNQGMTSFDISASFGYRNRALRFLGIGAGIDMMVNNSTRAYPVYALCRTTFTSAQKFVFLEAKAGVSFMSFYNNEQRCPIFGAIGFGFTLASGRNFSSHIILGYSYTPLRNLQMPDKIKPMTDLHQAVIRLGVAF